MPKLVKVKFKGLHAKQKPSTNTGRLTSLFKKNAGNSDPSMSWVTQLQTSQSLSELVIVDCDCEIFGESKSAQRTGLTFELAKETLTRSLGANLIRLELYFIPIYSPLIARLILEDMYGGDEKNWRDHEFFTEAYD